MMRIACPPCSGTLSTAATSVPPSVLIGCTSSGRLSARIIQIESARLNNAVGTPLPNGKVILKSALLRLATLPCTDLSVVAAFAGATDSFGAGGDTGICGCTTAAFGTSGNAPGPAEGSGATGTGGGTATAAGAAAGCVSLSPLGGAAGGAA